MRTVISILFVIAAVIWLALAGGNSTAPAPFAIFANYGFEVGAIYEKTRVNNNPFENADKPDTLTVVAIKGDYIKFNDNSTVKLGSIGLGFHNWKRL